MKFAFRVSTIVSGAQRLQDVLEALHAVHAVPAAITTMPLPEMSSLVETPFNSGLELLPVKGKRAYNKKKAKEPAYLTRSKEKWSKPNPLLGKKRSKASIAKYKATMAKRREEKAAAQK